MASAGSQDLPIRADGKDTLLVIRVTPKSNRDIIDGTRMLSDGRTILLVRVRALPESGSANAAVLHVLGKAFGMPPAKLTVVSGATSRLKTIRVKAPYEEMLACLATHALPGSDRCP